MPQTIDNMSVTWTNSLTTYTGIKLNAAGSSDANSAAGSLLMDLQVGGTSRFQVRKDGRFGGSSDNIISVGGRLDFAASNLVSASLNAANFNLSAATLSFTSSSGGANSGDLILGRRAAANLRLGAADAAAPVAQTLSVQSVVAGTSNTAGANLTITGSQGTGTGAGGSIIFQVAPAGSSGTAQNALQNALLIDGDGQATFTIKNTSGTPSLQIAKSGSSSIQITTSATFSVGSSASSLTLNANAGSSPIYAAGSYFNIGTAANNDVQLYRDAANILALRNGANAQTFRVYNTTDGTNSEWGLAGWVANEFVIGTEKAGITGTNRSLSLVSAANVFITRASGSEIRFYNGASVIWKFDGSGHFLTQADNAYDIGATSSGRPRSIYVGTNIFAGGYLATTSAVFPTGVSRSSISSPADGRMLLANTASTDFDRLQFGGTTSSFPALKRNSTALETKLADDSAYAPHAMQYLDVTDGITAPASATGRARIYVDTADGDLKVIFADGTVKTIVTDT